MNRFETVSIRTTITRQSTRIIPFLEFLDQCNNEGVILFKRLWTLRSGLSVYKYL